MASRPWRSPHHDDIPRKRPYSPPDSPARTTRMRNAIHKDVLFEQGVYPVYASFSSRGSRAIACFRNGYARVWNVDPVHDRFLDCEQVLRHGETVYRAAISDDGTRAVTTARDGVARFWDLSHPNYPRREITSNFRSTRSCNVSPDGRYIAATFYTGKKTPLSTFMGTVVLYDPDNDGDVFRSRLLGVPDKVCMSRDARVVAVGCYGTVPARMMARDTAITLLDGDGKVKHSFQRVFGDEQACLSWDLSDDGHMLAVCAQNRSVIELYSDRNPQQWAGTPVVLRAIAPLIYENCRIVGNRNGDLISALVLDTNTKERSVLIFEPSSGNVLFSLACGLKDSKSCIDLEPRVSYVAPSYERSERKVVRLLSRTGGEDASLTLVRCGDPPKNAFHGTTINATHTPPSSSLDRRSPLGRPKDPPNFGPSPGVHLLDDSSTPAIPKSPRFSPASTKTGPARPTVLPDDDTFALGKQNGSHSHSMLPSVMPKSPTISASNLSNSKSPTKQMPSISGQQVSAKRLDNINTKPMLSASMQLSSPQTCNDSPSDITKTPQTIQNANQSTENKPVVPNTKSCKLLRAKTETLSCKSRIASQSTLPQSSPPVNATTAKNAKGPSTNESEQRAVPKKSNNSAAQGSLKDNQYTEKREQDQANEATDLNKSPKTKPPKTDDECNDAEGKKTSSTESQGKDPSTQMKLAPVSNIKKPRWQRKVNKQHARNAVSGIDATGALPLERKQDGNLDDNFYGGKTDNSTDGNTMGVSGTTHHCPSERKQEEALAHTRQRPGTPPMCQATSDAAIFRPPKPLGKPNSSPDDTGNNITGLQPDQESPHKFAGSQAKSVAAKTEATLTYPNVGNSPQPLPITTYPNRKQAKYEMKRESQEICQNKYFEGLETAKALFLEASNEANGERVVSNVKGYKTLMELLRTDNELIDRKTVARIVYDKGGISNALNEKSFLEAFSDSYGEMQKVRQRLWSEVYDQAGGAEEVEGLLVFHARDLIKRECKVLNVQMNADVWCDQSLDDLIASQAKDGLLVDRDAFVRATDKIFSV